MFHKEGDAHGDELDLFPLLPTQSHEDDDSRTTMTDTHSVASSVASIFLDSSIEAQLENLQALYDPRLVLELDRFCYIPGHIASTEWLPTHGPMVDLSLLQAGCKVIINMKVTNHTPDEVQLDVTARNFQAEDTQQRTYAKALIPGFSRTLITTFTVPNDNRTVLAFIDVAVLSVRFGGGGAISCPVFYRVDSLATKNTFPKCTGYSLPDLLAQRNTKKHAYAPVTKEFATKQVQGKWARRTGKEGAFMLSLNR